MYLLPTEKQPQPPTPWHLIISAHLGLHLHGRPVGLNEAPAASDVDGVPGVAPTIVNELLRGPVLLRLGLIGFRTKTLQWWENLAESLDDDCMETGVGAHSLVQQCFRLNSKLNAPDHRSLLVFQRHWRKYFWKKPEEVGRSSSGVALLGVEQEPVPVFKLFLGDVPDQVIRWSGDQVVRWSGGQVVRWSGGQVVGFVLLKGEHQPAK